MSRDQLLPELPEFPKVPVEFETYQLPFCFTSSPAEVLLSHCPLTHALTWSLASAVLDPTFEIVYVNFLNFTFSVPTLANVLLQSKWLQAKRD